MNERLGRVETQLDPTRAVLEAKIDTNLRWIIALQAATWSLLWALKLFGQPIPTRSL